MNLRLRFLSTKALITSATITTTANNETTVRNGAPRTARINLNISSTLSRPQLENSSRTAQVIL